MYYNAGTGQNLSSGSMLCGARAETFSTRNLRPIFNNETGVEATEFYASLG